jgi:hypothetical protein
VGKMALARVIFDAMSGSAFEEPLEDDEFYGGDYKPCLSQTFHPVAALNPPRGKPRRISVMHLVAGVRVHL